MRKIVTFENIEKEIERLTLEDQLKLVEKLAHQLRKTGLVLSSLNTYTFIW